jgi:hypothetical protein
MLQTEVSVAAILSLLEFLRARRESGNS